MLGSLSRPVGALVCLLGLAAAPLAAGDALQATRDGESVVLFSLGGRSFVELGAGSARELPGAEGVELTSVAVVHEGWLAAGSSLNPDGERRLFLAYGDDAGYRLLPAPRGPVPAVRRLPVLLVEGGRLAGLAWLEGADGLSLSVRAAAWEGDGWGRTVRVSSPGPGTQTALTGTVLADGSWLLAWSAFDGEDDEILWSWRPGEEWLPPERLSPDNTVPDITPALTASAGGALVAWSRYDGNDYRLRVARFARGRWSDEAALGPKGSLYPSFFDGGERPCVLFRDAGAGGWTLAELTASGAVLRRTLPVPGPDERPAVRLGRGGEARLRWPGLDRETAVVLRGER